MAGNFTVDQEVILIPTMKLYRISEIVKGGYMIQALVNQDDVSFTTGEWLDAGEWVSLDTRWTVAKPKTPGYYWAYENLPEVDADVMLMRVDESLVKCFWAEDGMEFSVEQFSRWIGPLNTPKAPQ